MSLATPSRLDHELLDAAFAAVAEGVDRGALPSAVLAVANRHEIVRLEAFGPVQTDSIFLLASITKPIFSTAVMRLVERAKLRLNDPVVRLLPEFGANGKQDVRLWHLLTHTSGLDESAAQYGWGRLGREELQAASFAGPRLFRPGSRYQYCNTSFAVMAALIRRASGDDDVAYLREHVLAPLGMKDTSYAPPDSPRVAPVHTPPWADEAGRRYWTSLAIPAGGLWSTAEDMVRFGQSFLDGRGVLGRSAMHAMTSLQTEGIPAATATGEARSYYGLGFGKAGPHSERGPSSELRTPAGYGHGGATGTLLWIEPELDLVFVFLTNKWGMDEPHAGLALNAAIAAA
jgi:CubicO group peptidase (beta-lactamase class C family)